MPLKGTSRATIGFAFLYLRSARRTHQVARRELLDPASSRSLAILRAHAATKAQPRNSNRNQTRIDETEHEPAAKRVPHSVVVHQEIQYEKEGVQHIRTPP